MQKSFNTRFAIMMPGHDFYKEDGEIKIFSISQVKIKMKELKSSGYEVQAIPHCDE